MVTNGGDSYTLWKVNSTDYVIFRSESTRIVTHKKITVPSGGSLLCYSSNVCYESNTNQFYQAHSNPTNLDMITLTISDLPTTI